MSNLTIATLFIVLANILMFFTSTAMIDLNPSGSVCYHSEGSVIDSTVNTGELNNDVLGQLPGAQASPVTAGTTTITFTDIFNNILGWFKSAPGIKYVYGVVAAPANLIACLGLPGYVSVGLGGAWYLVTFLVLLGFIWGRDS